MLIINQGRLVLDGSPQELGSAMGDRFKVSLEVKATEQQLLQVLNPWEKAKSEVIASSSASLDTADRLSHVPASVHVRLTGETSEDFREELFTCCRVQICLYWR